MASGFTRVEGICEGDHCGAVAVVTYTVPEKKRLCRACIDNARGGLYCKNHDQEMKLFCQTHGTSMCCEGALEDHRQNTCVHRQLDDVIAENTAKFQDLNQQVIERGILWRVHGDHIRQCRIDVDDHLKSVKRDVDSFIDDEKKKEDEDEKERITKINQEIDEKNAKLLDKIRRNNIVREERLELTRENAEKQRAVGEKKRCELYADLQSIAEEIEQPIAELEKSWRDGTQASVNATQMIDTVLQDKKNIANEEQHVSTSVINALQLAVDKDRVGHITSAASSVRFAKGPGRERYYGRIDTYDGEWRLTDIMHFADEIKSPAIVGCLDENHVVITDCTKDNRHTYVLDTKTKRTTRVIAGTTGSFVSSCAVLTDKIVTGEVRSGPAEDSLRECVKIYDMQWNPKLKITIPLVKPIETKFHFSWVIVSGDQDGMILAAEFGGREIFVINPAQGNIIQTIGCNRNVMLGGVQTSGDIYARPSPPERVVLLIDKRGHQREIPVKHDNLWNVFIDPATDDLYTVATTDHYKSCVIDQLTSGREVKERRVASYPIPREVISAPLEPYHVSFSRVMVMSRGQIIASDKGSIMMFRKY